MSTLEHKQQLLGLLFDEEQFPSEEQALEEYERREQPRMKLLEFLECKLFYYSFLIMKQLLSH